MTDSKYLNIELRIATTGEIYAIEDISEAVTVKDLISEFCQSQNLEPELGLSWKLLFTGMVMDSNAKLHTLLADVDHPVLELMLKVEGAKCNEDN